MNALAEVTLKEAVSVGDSRLMTAPDILNALTPRERQIALLVAQGMSNKAAGQVLGISHWTVAAHLKATFSKLGVVRRAELGPLLRAHMTNMI